MRASASKKDLASALASAELNPLHSELAVRITRVIHDDALKPGDRLFEERMATRLGLSKTPVRAALKFLADQRFVTRERNIGFVLLKRPPLLAPAATAPKVDDELLVQIAVDRRSGQLPDQLSENELIGRYAITRSAAKKLLVRLVEVGVVERGLGFRYKFVDSTYDAQVKLESFRFRLLVEPAVLREPAFNPPQAWIDDLRQQHQSFIDARWTRSSSVAFFEMNVAFHEGLAIHSGNRFVAEGLHHINQRRRLALYDWWHGHDRVEQSCREHLAILDAIEHRKMPLASRLMRDHLNGSRLAPSRQSPQRP